MSKCSFALFCVSILMAPLAALSQSPAELSRPLPRDSAVITDTLANGLRYYVRANRKPEHRAELRLVVNAGSVLEDEDQRGLAHFVEHMAFDGTEHFPKKELQNYIESVGMQFGADLNAETGFDETVYQLQLPTDTARILEQGFQILEDWAHGVVLDSMAIRNERGVVIEEWRLRQGAGSRILDKQLPVLFAGSRYADRLPIGQRSTLESFPSASLRRFYRDWYRPDLMAVVAVGDFDPRSVEKLIRAHFSAIARPTQERSRTVFPIPDNDTALVAVTTDKEATSSSVEIAWKQPLRDKRTIGAFRQEMVEHLYNSMLNQRFHELAQKPDAPFLGASSSQGLFIRSKEIYSLDASVKSGGIVRGLDALLTEAERVARHGFTATELERQKRDLLRSVEQAYAERDKTESGAYVGQYVNAYLYAEPVTSISTDFELYRKLLPGIQLDEVNRLATSWLTERNRVILASAPARDSASLPSRRTLLAAFDSVKRRPVVAYKDQVTAGPLIERAPAPGRIVSERVDSAVGVTTWILSNGARVLLKPTDFKADEVLLAGWSPGGTSLLPDREYMAARNGAVIVQQSGIGRFSRIELQKALAGQAVSILPYIASLEQGISGSASPRDLESLFELLYLDFTAPRTDSSAFAAYRGRVSAQLANRGASPEAAFADSLAVTLTQHSWRARPITPAVFEEVDLGKSLAFYRDRFSDASGFTFVIVGSVQPDTLRPLVERWVASLPSTHRRESWRDVGVKPPPGVVTTVVKRGVEQKSQSVLIFHGPFEFSAPNRYLLASLVEVLQLRLQETLRESLGGTYDVEVGGSGERDPRPEYQISVQFGSSPARVDELVKAVMAQIDSLKRTGPTPRELSKVREQQIRSRETGLKENGFWLASIENYDRYGWKLSDILALDERLKLLTSDRIRDAARRYLDDTSYVRGSLLPEK